MSFFKFNSFAGRLAPSSQRAAYAPAGLQAEVAEVASFQFDTSATRAARVEAPAAFSSAAALDTKGGNVPTSSTYKKVMGIQSKMGTNDGLLVWQKLAGRDRGLYGFTMLATVGAVFYVGYAIAQMSFPKPPAQD